MRLTTCFLLALLSGTAVAEDGLVLRLPLDKEPAGRSPDSAPLKVTPRGKLARTEGRAAGTASHAFDGGTSRLLVQDAAPLDLGTGDFTVSLWLHTDENLRDDLGDILAKYDPENRRGFVLSLRSNTGVVSCQSNWRQLQFGIDNGRPAQFRDEGRPGHALLAFALCVHEGRLYAGTCEPDAGQSGRIYRYEGPGNWMDLGSPDGSNSVSAMAAYKGSLYAGTAKYRVAGSSLPESPNTTLGGRVFRLDNGKWADCGQLPATEAVGGLVVYDGRLYASSLYKPAGFFRYEDNGRWSSLPPPKGQRVEALGVFNGDLYASSYDGGKVYRFNGQEWADLGLVGDNTQTYSFACYNGRLHVGTWPSGKVFRLGSGDRWDDSGRLGQELEVMGLAVHNGKLYGGTLPLGEIHRYDGQTGWTRLEQLDRTPNVKYRRVWAMAQYQGRLFSSTLPSGHVHSMDAGVSVTHDRELPPGWHHLAAVRRGKHLELFVDGHPAARSAELNPQDFDLSNDSPLEIGGGPTDGFAGRLSDVQIHRMALSPEAIAEAAKKR